MGLQGYKTGYLSRNWIPIKKNWINLDTLEKLDTLGKLDRTGYLRLTLRFIILRLRLILPLQGLKSLDVKTGKL